MGKKRVLNGMAALALVLAGVPAGAFAEPYDLSRLAAATPGFAPGAAQRRLAAGVALRLPLGNAKRSLWRESEVSLGFDLRSGSGAYAGRPVIAESRPLWRLSMTFEGPGTLALNGVRFADMRRLHADGDGEEDGGVNWWWVGGGVLAAGFAASLIAFAADDCPFGSPCEN
ncbi:MAG: hypothetical protein ACE5ED_03165 [Rhodothalassiaceae bacterium]